MPIAYLSIRIYLSAHLFLALQCLCTRATAHQSDARYPIFARPPAELLFDHGLCQICSRHQCFVPTQTSLIPALESRASGWPPSSLPLLRPGGLYGYSSRVWAHFGNFKRITPFPPWSLLCLFLSRRYRRRAACEIGGSQLGPASPPLSLFSTGREGHRAKRSTPTALVPASRLCSGTIDFYLISRCSWWLD
ncbi:hypothetical protein V8C26DRAFT_414302 [Trichoderma gracile]